MATYTVNTNAARETALTFVVARLNAKRAAQTPPLAPVTNDQYLQARLNDLFDDYGKQRQRKLEYDALSPAARDALGVRDDD